MEGVAALYRAAGVLRNHFERTVLAEVGLTWTSWIVLQVVWVWREIETRHAAAEAGISKSTLTGVITTLHRRHLLVRRVHPTDGRRVLLSPTPRGADLVASLLPRVNESESAALRCLTGVQIRDLSRMLREVVQSLEQNFPETDGDAGPAAGTSVVAPSAPIRTADTDTTPGRPPSRG